MQHFEVAMTLIEQGDFYCMQLRTGANQRGMLGKIGCFGGAVDEDEAVMEAARRELAEESSLNPPIEELEYIGEVDVNSERENRPITVHATIFRLQLPPEAAVEAREGELIRVPKHSVGEYFDRFSAAAQALFEQLIPQE